MVYRALADVVVVVHFAFVVFIAVGGLLAWRWPRLLWLHVPAVIWGLGIVTIGYECPLTPLERYLRRLGGEHVPRAGFIDRYIEGVLYPERYTSLLRALVAVLVLVGWTGALIRLRRTRSAAHPGRTASSSPA
ncbi:MAG TPA: DUF2784 domain-containing protein [Acidimicrobiales bacterium]|nr:DUF2784 domain-containing protein [Acidimicrobiales bacterium]